MDAWGIVAEDRGSLAFSLIHGESLVAAAAFGLEAADVTLVDPRTDLAILREEGLPLVLGDPLCPLTPPEFIADAVERSAATGAIVVGARPVTDTVKAVAADGTVGTTVDRDDLIEITSPIVLPAAVVAGLDALPAGAFRDLVADYRSRWPVLILQAPPLGRRIHDTDDIAVLEALSRPEHLTM